MAHKTRIQFKPTPQYDDKVRTPSARQFYAKRKACSLTESRLFSYEHAQRSLPFSHVSMHT